eukprot:7383724-Prymnesium_polylepis.2
MLASSPSSSRSSMEPSYRTGPPRYARRSCAKPSLRKSGSRAGSAGLTIEIRGPLGFGASAACTCELSAARSRPHEPMPT